LSGVVPVEARLKFERDASGRVSALLWQPERGEALRLPRDEAYREEEVRFVHGGTRLAGTLRLPKAPGPHPAIVLVHGSGAQGRGGLLPFVAPLLADGYAVLGYDKRGAGASEGDWRAASFEDLAGDALAAVSFLRSRPEIDPGAVGLLGASQGGWVAPLAASRSAEVAFVVSVSGPGVSPAEETADFVEHEMRAEGFGDAEVAAALDMARLRDAYARTGAGWDEVQAAAARVAGEAWYQAWPVPPREDPFWPFWKRILDHDPAPVLAKLRCPVLALFGGRDRNVLAQKNADRWDAALGRGRHVDYTLVTLPTANHVLFEARLGTVSEFPGLRRFAPGYAETLRAWLERRFPPRRAARPHNDQEAEGR
jgi:pimeloyl-ACP methyl ester carboxylesterase